MPVRASSRDTLKAIGGLLILAGVPTLAPGQSFSAHSGMPVRIEIVATCSLTASDLDFGAYDPSAAAPKQGQTTIQLRCAAGETAELSLDGGTAPGGNTSRRKLGSESGPDRLDYGLFQDPARTVEWGERSGRDTLEVLTTGSMQSVPVYGEIPAGQRTRDGTYSDTITVRLQL